MFGPGNISNDGAVFNYPVVKAPDVVAPVVAQAVALSVAPAPAKPSIRQVPQKGSGLRKAYILVGNTVSEGVDLNGHWILKPLNPWIPKKWVSDSVKSLTAKGQNWTTGTGITLDVGRIIDKFTDYGCTDVLLNSRATQKDMLDVLSNSDYVAVAFIGHNAGPGFINTSDEDPDNDFIGSDLIKKAIGGRKLEYAIVHSCYSNLPDTIGNYLRDALVGDKGKWEGITGLWNPALCVEMPDGMGNGIFGKR